MLTPLEQTPSLAFEPARQQFIPMHPVEPPPPPSTAATVQPATSSSSQDSTSQQGSGNDNDSTQQKAMTDASQRLGAAWGYLEELKQQAAAAVSNGDVRGAQEIAGEAASVAASIRDIANVMSVPGGTVQSAQQEATTVSASPDQDSGQTFGSAGGPSAGTTFGSAGGPSKGTTFGSAGGPASGPTLGSAGGVPRGPILGSAGGPSAGATDNASVIDLARSGLSTAKDVVDLVAQLPQDRTALDAYTRNVLDAMSAVETMAAVFASASAGGQVQAPQSTRLDINA